MKRESFGSRLGFILVSAGCAIGIGNVWKFPYICGHMERSLYPDLLMLSGYSGYSGSGSRICSRTWKPHKCCEMF